MARQKTSPFEDMILIVSKLPWWAGLALAVISYLVLHAVASRPVIPATASPGQLGNAMAKGLFTTMAMFGQFVLPIAFGFGALLSTVTAMRQKRLFEKVATRPGVAVLNDMSWSDFERLVSEYYRRKGFQVTREGGNGPDGGIDLVLRLGGEVHLVQCKHWKAYKVGVQLVREFYGVMAARGAAGGYFVTSGEYTDDAKAFASGLNLTLVDGRKLREIIGSVKADAGGSTPSIDVTPVCPKCGSEMKKRVARSGSNAGSEFWGCVNYPRCNGTRAIIEERVPSPEVSAAGLAIAAMKECPNCGNELVARQVQSGPKAGQNILGCLSCKKAWPAVGGDVAATAVSARQRDFDIR